MRRVKTMNRASLLIAGALLTASAGAGLAQDGRSGRYTMHKSEDGFVRLDTETGAMAVCKRIDNDWACRAMADDSATMRKQIDKLKADNARLNDDVKRMEELLELRDGDKPARSHRRRHGFNLPTEREVDEALDYFERMLKKFQNRLKRLERGDRDDPSQL